MNTHPPKGVWCVPDGPHPLTWAPRWGFGSSGYPSLPPRHLMSLDRGDASSNNPGSTDGLGSRWWHLSPPGHVNTHPLSHGGIHTVASSYVSATHAHSPSPVTSSLPSWNSVRDQAPLTWNLVSKCSDVPSSSCLYVLQSFLLLAGGDGHHACMTVRDNTHA